MSVYYHAIELAVARLYEPEFTAHPFSRPTADNAKPLVVIMSAEPGVLESLSAIDTAKKFDIIMSCIKSSYRARFRSAFFQNCPQEARSYSLYAISSCIWGLGREEALRSRILEDDEIVGIIAKLWYVDMSNSKAGCGTTIILEMLLWPIIHFNYTPRVYRLILEQSNNNVLQTVRHVMTEIRATLKRKDPSPFIVTNNLKLVLCFLDILWHRHPFRRRRSIMAQFTESWMLSAMCS